MEYGSRSETSLVIAQKNQLGVTLLEELNDLDTLQDLEKSSLTYVIGMLRLSLRYCIIIP